MSEHGGGQWLGAGPGQERDNKALAGENALLTAVAIAKSDFAKSGLAERGDLCAVLASCCLQRSFIAGVRAGREGEATCSLLALLAGGWEMWGEDLVQSADFVRWGKTGGEFYRAMADDYRAVAIMVDATAARIDGAPPGAGSAIYDHAVGEVLRQLEASAAEDIDMGGTAARCEFAAVVLWEAAVEYYLRARKGKKAVAAWSALITIDKHREEDFNLMGRISRGYVKALAARFEMLALHMNMASGFPYLFESA